MYIFHNGRAEEVDSTYIRQGQSISSEAKPRLIWTVRAWYKSNLPPRPSRCERYTVYTPSVGCREAAASSWAADADDLMRMRMIWCGCGWFGLYHPHIASGEEYKEEKIGDFCPTLGRRGIEWLKARLAKKKKMGKTRLVKSSFGQTLVRAKIIKAKACLDKTRLAKLVLTNGPLDKTCLFIYF